LNPVAESIKEQIKGVRTAFEEALASASQTEALEEARVRFTGKKGELTSLLRSLGKLSPRRGPPWGRS
jgi:phenylalanyl-tRNA synthetase alpha chain